MENNAILEMLIEQNELIQSLDKKTNQKLNIEKVERLTDQIQTSITKIDDAIEQTHQPVVKQHKFTIDIMSGGIVFIFIGMVIIISALSAGLYIAQQPNYDQRDNDLKYRYIKMKGEATPKQISELETIFELNRDNAKIRQMHKNVGQYEETIKRQLALEEQARLKQIEIKSLNHEANSLKFK